METIAEGRPEDLGRRGLSRRGASTSATGDRDLRDRLIFMFTPMVRYIVYRKVREVPAQCEVEDFLSCGLEALIRSIERYDPDKGATLEQYAWTRIHGAVLDELRRHDWAPRSLRRDERAINHARESFLADHERQPSREELAADGRHGARRAARPPGPGGAGRGRLAEPHGALGRERDDRADRHAGEHRHRLRPDRQRRAPRSQGALPQGVRAARRQEREVAVLLYVEDWTLRDIGARLGVSESRVSQIHTQLRRRLYDQLSGELPLFSAVG